MDYALVRKIIRRNPFSIEKLPLVTRIYRYPFEKYETLGKLALFGAPYLAVFYICRRILGLKPIGTFEFEIDGRKKPIRFDGSNTQFSALYFSRFSSGYEPHVSALLDVLVPGRGNFLDIGSNWGWFSLFVASNKNFKGAVHAFEPFPSSFSDLVATVEQADLRDKVKCHDVALSNRDGQGSMFLPDNFQSGGATLTAETQQKSTVGAIVKLASLDSLELGAVGVVKIDAEGSELPILEGGESLLQNQKPMIVFESGKHPLNAGGTLGSMVYLSKFGYVFFHLSWLRRWNDISFFVGDDSDPDPRSEEELALVKFELQERFLHQDSMNIFACHEERLSETELLFDRYSSGFMKK